MIEQQQSAFDELNQEDIQDLQTYVGPQSDRYVERWQRIEQQKSSMSWNWAAFIFSFMWFGYRKIHFVPVLFLFSLIVLDYLFHFAFGEEMIGGLVAGVHVVLALLANKIYFDNAIKKTLHIQRQFPSQEVRDKVLRSRGGTSWRWAALYLLIFIFHYLILGTIKADGEL